jgi:DNA-binding GntR family transcriptional regulator
MARVPGVTSIVDAIAHDLRRQLFRGELPGDEPLTEAGVSEQYEVARPTAKAAIEKLVSEGLLVRGVHRSARVPRLDAADARDIYRTRADVESIALRRLAATRTVPDEARRANAEIASLGDASALEVVDPDMRFHTCLVDAIGSPRLGRAYLSLASEVRLCMAQVQGGSLLSTALIHAEHERLLELVEAGDDDGAVALLERHLARARERLVGVLGGTPGPEAAWSDDVSQVGGPRG